jgi:hypothetical protein
MNTHLRDLYLQINSRSFPVPQEELLDDQISYCKAIWAIGQWKLHSSYFTLVSELRSVFGEKALYYSPNEEAGEGLLHWTLFQINTFPVIPERSAHPTFDTEAELLRRSIYSRPQLRISFSGISKSKHGLFLCGFPSWNINTLRDELRTEMQQGHIYYNEPHPQDICHATLLRLLHDLTPTERYQLDTIIEKYRDIELIEFIPEKWEFGFGTWRQTSSERKVIESWPAVPRWILHRGLSSGPDRALENNEEHIWKQLHDGWDIECDIWYIDGKWWLGHDEPCAQLQNLELLTHSHAWVHCKHIPALVECMRRCRETDVIIHCFSHDSDDAILTSQGYIWAYPGHIIHNSHAICVMPERHGFTLHNIMPTGGVCSDFLPIHFL